MNTCICCRKIITIKRLCHVQIQENTVRERVSMGLIKVNHIEGNKNPSGIFTKEDKDIEDFI